MEIEHVDVETLDVLEKQGMDCQPNASTIRLIQVSKLWISFDLLTFSILVLQTMIITYCGPWDCTLIFIC